MESAEGYAGNKTGTRKVLINDVRAREDLERRYSRHGVER